jgi:LysR family transcriptional regulator, benzoate and cis,cis-muconate-responsive activator of ben and cat genes
LRKFRENHSHVEAHPLYIRTQGQKLALANDDVDPGFMVGPFNHPDLETRQLTSEPLYAIIPLGHRVLEKSELMPADLRDEPLLLGDLLEWAEFRWRLTDLFSAEGMELRPRLESSNMLALIGLVVAGLGVTIYPESVIGNLGRNVAVRPIAHPAFRSGT